MLQDPLGIYDQASRRHAELHRSAQRAAMVAAIRPAPRWRLTAASLLRRIADRVDGMCAATPGAAREA